MKSFFISYLLALSSFTAPLAPLAAGTAAKPSSVEETTEEQVQPVVIIGGGIGALTSALYLARAGLEPTVIEGPARGGLLTQSQSVQNWPGELEIDGTQLTEKVRLQAEENGARFRTEEVIGVDFSKRPFIITTRSLDKNGKTAQIRAEACIIAMGTKPNFLGIPGESGPNGYWGKGISNCAICDGTLYRDQVVGVVGGGDAAVLEALYLSNIAKEVHVFVRKGSLKTTEEKRVQTLLTKPNVKIRYNTSVQEIKGDGEKLTHIILKDESKKRTDFQLDGLFLAIGSTPNTHLFEKILKLDNKGYILLEKDQQSSIEGVYAIGDIVDPVYKQAISASGDGAKAALQAQQYVSDRANNLIVKNRSSTPKVPTDALIAEVIEIVSQEQFEKELQSSDIPVVVDFYATWCGPCKSLSPLLESSANQLNGKVKFLKVNVDKFYELSATYNIRAMPTVLYFNSSGEETDRKVGTEQIQDLLNQLENSLNG